MPRILERKPKEEKGRMLMGMTLGELLFYGGIAGIALFGLLFIILWFVFEGKKKRLVKRIEQEIYYEKAMEEP